jgi:hypothetical protein
VNSAGGDGRTQSRGWSDGAVGTLRTGYPAHKLQVKTIAPTSWLRVALRSLCIPTGRASSPTSGQLWGRHVSPRLGLPLPARGSSGAAMCPRGSGSPFQLGAAPGAPRVPGALRAAGK